MKLFLGISGKMGSGKTTLTEGIRNSLNTFTSEVVSLAKPIKDIQHMIYNELDLEMVGEKDRDLLIKLGMWGRDKSPTLWLEQAVKKFKSSPADIVICDDVRFGNEAEWFEENGLLIRIEGEQRGTNVDDSKKSDSSETALDEFDFKYTVNNHSGVENTLMSALYCVSQHLNVTEQLMDQVARGVVKGGS